MGGEKTNVGCYFHAPGVLREDERLVSENGEFCFEVSGGRASVRSFKDGCVYWQSANAPSKTAEAPFHVFLANDGTFKVCDARGEAVWKSENSGLPVGEHVLSMQDDGVLTVRSIPEGPPGEVVWNSTGKCMGSFVYAPFIFGPQSNLLSPDGAYRMIFQEDGNLVIDRTEDHHCMWASNSHGKGPTPRRFVVQTDGNVIVYDAKGHGTWMAGAHPTEHVPYTLSIGNDARIVLRNSAEEELWSS